MTEQFVVNWHILEACNYACKYCYARYPDLEYSREMWKRPDDWKRVLNDAKSLPKNESGDWSGLRLNIAGGEPMLLWRKGKGELNEVLEYAESLGFALSIITNGSLVDDLFIETWGPKLQTLGISMDTSSEETNSKIGRCGNKGDWTTVEMWFEFSRSVAE